MSGIDLYYFPTPNGKKITIALEEMGLPYRVHRVDILKDEQDDPAFRALSPNGRIPALVDVREDGERVVVFESGAILQHLGRKTGLFYPADEAQRADVDAWLFWQMAGLGPMSGQVGFFTRAAAKEGRDPRDTSFAIHRYEKEVKRLYAVLESQLAGRDYICDAYSIADMASWPWIDQTNHYAGGLSLYPNIAAWHARMAARPAVERGKIVGMDEVAR